MWARLRWGGQPQGFVQIPVHKHSGPLDNRQGNGFGVLDHGQYAGNPQQVFATLGGGRFDFAQFAPFA
ncbi:hypothetical protein D3C79_1034100 [compost metagenome]